MQDEEVPRQQIILNRMIMQLFYEELDRRYFFIRIVVLSLFVLGFAFLLVPAISVFIRVTTVLVQVLGR